MCAFHRRLVRIAFVALALCLSTADTLAQERVVTIGDSWAWLIANGAPGSAVNAPGFGNALQTMLSTYHPGVTVANESFMGGTAAQHATMLGDITNRINAHPQADIVWLSSGGNDMLLGLAGGGFYVNNPNNPAVYAAVQQNVQTVVNHILSIRPDVQVVIEGYDYLNIWDTIPGGSGDPIRLNLGVVRASTGNGALDQFLNIQQNQAVNDGFKQAEQGKIALADASRRVHHISNFGLNNSLLGYNGLLGNVPGQGFYPPELWPQLPTPLGVMNTTDPIHLNTAGYLNLANRAEGQFFNTALGAANLALSTNSLNLGNVLVGTSATGAVTASNAGPNFTKVKSLNFPAASGEFGGAAQAFNPLFQDPLLGSDTAVKNYSYTPSGRGSDNQALVVTSDSGNRNLTLSGRGVAPINQVATVAAPPTRIGTSSTASISVANTGDGNLAGLGSTSNLHGTLAAAAGVFSAPGASLDLSDGAATSVVYGFAPTAHGAASTSVLASFSNGHAAGTNAPQNVSALLSGIGVGPVFQSSASLLDFGLAVPGLPLSLPLWLANTSVDANGGDVTLTNLSLLSASITGPDAGLFSLSGFTPGTVLGQGGLANLGLGFLGAGPVGTKSAQLRFTTDVGAAFGAVGQTFTIDLAAQLATGLTYAVDATDLDTKQVLNFSTAGTQVLADAADGLLAPLALATAADGTSYVSDVLRNRVVHIATNGTTSIFADAADGVLTPTGLAFDAGGTLFVANYLGRSIVAIDAAGQGSLFADSADGLTSPFDLAFDPLGNLLVADLDTARVLRFNALGQATTFADAADGLLSPIGLAVDALGTVYVADVLRNSIFRFDANGQGTLFANFQDGLQGPIGMTTDVAGNLYVANYLGHKIVRFDPLGNASLFADASNGLAGPFDVALSLVGLPLAPGGGFAAVPEPASGGLALLGAAWGGLVARQRRRRATVGKWTCPETRTATSGSGSLAILFAGPLLGRKGK